MIDKFEPDEDFLLTLPNKLFEHKLAKFSTMTIKALKETIDKWGVVTSDLPANPMKKDLVYTLETFAKENGKMYNDGSRFKCHRVNMVPMNGYSVNGPLANGPSVWYETYDIQGDTLFKKINTENYILINGATTNNLTYNIYKNQWSEDRIHKNQKTKFFEPRILRQTGIDRYKVSYYDELKFITLYLEKRNAYINALLFESVLNKDLVGYIRSLL